MSIYWAMEKRHISLYGGQARNLRIHEIGMQISDKMSVVVKAEQILRKVFYARKGKVVVSLCMFKKSESSCLTLGI